MGVLERISSERSLMFGKQRRMTARSAAEILPPDVGREEKPMGWSELDEIPWELFCQAPGFGMCCWVGTCWWGG